MPNRALSDWIDTYMLYTDNSEPAEAFKLWTAISCIASCLKRKCWLDWGTLTFYPNLYIVLVGPSGSRKGTAMGPGFKMLQELGIRMAAEATTRESLIRELRKSSDNNVDTLAGEFSMHSSLTIYSQELTVFLGYNNLQLISDLTDWYDCRERWIYRTKNQGEDDIIGVWVNLFGATTPSLLQTTLPLDAVGGGLTSRMIFVYEAKKGKVVPVPFLTEEQESLRPKLIHDLESIHIMKGQFKYASDFVDYYVNWYTQQTDSPPFKDDRFEGYIERRANHILKLSMIYSASRSGEMYLRELDIRRAIETLKLAEVKMPAAFAGVGRSPTASLVGRLNAMLEIETEISVDHLHAHFIHDATAREVDSVIDSLSKANQIILERRGVKTYIRRNPNYGRT